MIDKCKERGGQEKQDAKERNRIIEKWNDMKKKERDAGRKKEIERIT